MITLRFGTAELEQWAAFSGDRNPIHFDPAAARRLGAEGVVVHGMLPILHAETEVFEEARRASRHLGWKTWRARLKRPLLAGRDAWLRIEQGGSRFALIDAASGDKLVHGGLEDAAAGPLHAEAEDPHRAGDPTPLEFAAVELDGRAVRGRVGDLRKRLPELARHPWVMLSAIAFSEFLGRALVPLRAAAVRFVLGPSMVSAGEAVAVQTTHAVRFNDALLARLGEGLQSCTCAFEAMTIHGIADGCCGTARVGITLGQQPVMEMSIGLMMRAATNQQNRPASEASMTALPTGLPAPTQALQVEEPR